MRALTAALVVALAAAGTAGAQQRPPEEPERRFPEWILPQAQLSPRSHFFGEIVEARVSVVVDASVVDPESVRVEPKLFPYEPAGAARETRVRRGDALRIVHRLPVACAAPACVRRIGSDTGGHGRVGEVALPPAVVHLRLRASRFARTLRVPWQTSFLASRLSGPQLARLPGGDAYQAFNPYTANFRAPTEPPAPTYRVTPLVATGALAGIGLLALAGAGLVLAPLLPRRRPAFLEAPPRTPLEEALDVVAAVSANGAGGAEHREALEHLARELRSAGLSQFTPRATRLAWSSAPPTRGDSEALVGEVRRVLEEAS